MTQSKRLALPDCIRGLTLISMIAYHGIWNLVWLYGMDWQWYRGLPGYIWQQSIRQESTWQQCIGKQSIGKRPGFSNLLSTTSAMVGA